MIVLQLDTFIPSACSGSGLGEHCPFYVPANATKISPLYLSRGCSMRFVVHGWAQDAFDMNSLSTELYEVTYSYSYKALKVVSYSFLCIIFWCKI